MNSTILAVSLCTALLGAQDAKPKAAKVETDTVWTFRISGIAG